MDDGGKVILREIFLDHHAVDRRRRAKRRYLIFSQQRQEVLRVEALKFERRHRAFAEPLPVELAPERLAPARIGNGQVQPVGMDAVPVLCGHEMPERVFAAVGGDLGVARRAGGKEHQHGVVALNRVLGALKAAAEARILLVEAMPAFAASADENARLQRRAAFLAKLRLCGNVAVRRADDSGDVRGLIAVGKVVRHELIRCRNGHRADFMQREHGKPELVMALEYQHDLVALLDAERKEVVGAAVGGLHHVLKREAAFRSVVVHMQHGELVGRFLRDCVHDVERKIELVRVREANAGKLSLRILARVDKAIGNEVLGLSRFHDARVQFRSVLRAFARQNDRNKQALFAADGEHAVGSCAVVVDAVAFVQHFDVLADLHLERAAEHEVELLAVVRGQVDGTVLLRFRIVVPHPVRLGDLVAEHRSEAVDFNAFLLGGGLALAFPRHRVGREARAVAFQQIGNADAERERALMDKRKRKIRSARFIRRVLGNGNVGFFRHLLAGKAGDFPHFANPVRNLQELRVQFYRFHIYRFHSASLPADWLPNHIVFSRTSSAPDLHNLSRQ